MTFWAYSKLAATRPREILYTVFSIDAVVLTRMFLGG